MDKKPILIIAAGENSPDLRYATGFAAATALANKITYGSQEDKDKYLDFLKSGSSDYPINIMQKAGVDIRAASVP